MGLNGGVKMQKKGKEFLIFFFLVFFSFIPASYMLKLGFINGHDTPFHYAQIYDLYNAWSHKSFINYISYDLNNGLGMGTKIFYAPLAHMLVVIIYFALRIFGLNLTQAFKIVLYLSILLSGVFTYLLGKKITNKNYIGLLIAVIYMLFPYRYAVIYTRNAFAEAIAMTFIPLVFLGLYDLLKMQEFKIEPFIEVILGFTLCFLTHNITFLFTVVFAIIFILFHFKDTINFFRKKANIWATIVSFVLMLLFVSPLLLPMLEAKKSGLYRIFNAEAMRTGLSYILAIKKETSLLYLFYHVNDNYLFDIMFFLLLAAPFLIEFLLFHFLRKSKKLFLGLSVLNGLLLITFIIFATFKHISPMIYALLVTIICGTLLSLKTIKEKKNHLKARLLDLICFLFLTVLTIILILQVDLWKFLPSFLYNVQFPWRLWSFVGFFIAVFIGLFILVIDYYLPKGLSHAFSALLIGICVLLIYPTNMTSSWDYSDKNIIYPENENKRPEYHLITADSTYYIYGSGWQLEYFTNDWWNGPKSSFWWKCYNTMKDPNNHDYINEVYIVNKGAASLINYQYQPEEINFEIAVTSETEIEIPKIYYDGYEITITNEDGTAKLDYYQKEGFVTIKLNKGGKICVKYVGTNVQNASRYLCYLGIIVGVTLISLYYLDRKLKKRKVLNII